METKFKLSTGCRDILKYLGHYWYIPVVLAVLAVVLIVVMGKDFSHDNIKTSCFITSFFAIYLGMCASEGYGEQQNDFMLSFMIYDLIFAIVGLL